MFAMFGVFACDTLHAASPTQHPTFAAREAAFMARDGVAFLIREARPDDLPALAALHVETFKQAHGHRRAPSYELRETQWRAAFERETDWFCYVAEVAEAPDGRLVGFAKGTLHDGGVPGFEGELNKIYVLRAWHRRGIGRALVDQVARRFLAQGIGSMLLFGDARSPSNGFYERLGAERLQSPGGEFHGGYGWRDLRRLVATETDQVPR
jgi:ribosomal protein S18 acetylase RimI-like enzyme